MDKREIVVSTSDQRHISFCVGEGEIDPYINYILAFKWFRMGELNEVSLNKMNEFFKEKGVNV
jgi:hypothetical protein